MEMIDFCIIFNMIVKCMLKVTRSNKYLYKILQEFNKIFDKIQKDIKRVGIVF